MNGDSTARGIGELVGAFYDRLWNAWDDASVDDLLAEGFLFRGSLGTATVGRDEWRAYRDTIRRGAADFHNEVLTVVAEGDAAAARLRYSGTHTGELLGRAPTGRTFAYDGTAFFTSEAGQLTSAWVLGDLASLTAQLTAPRESGADAAGQETNVLTIVRADVDQGRADELVAAYEALLAEGLPDGLVETQLLGDGEGHWAIHSLWRDREALDAMRARPEPPAAPALFRRFAADPTLTVLAVLADSRRGS